MFAIHSCSMSHNQVQQGCTGSLSTDHSELPEMRDCEREYHVKRTDRLRWCHLLGGDVINLLGAGFGALWQQVNLFF